MATWGNGGLRSHPRGLNSFAVWQRRLTQYSRLPPCSPVSVVNAWWLFPRTSPIPGSSSTTRIRIRTPRGPSTQRSVQTQAALKLGRTSLWGVASAGLAFAVPRSPWPARQGVQQILWRAQHDGTNARSAGVRECQEASDIVGPGHVDQGGHALQSSFELPVVPLVELPVVPLVLLARE